jgi:Secretion system C-terminal sorting domain
MKNTIALGLTFMGITQFLSAQPVYNACISQPQPGDIWMREWTHCDTFDLDPGWAGANVVWDFSDWTALAAYTVIDTCFTTASLPQAINFPNSNLALREGDQARFWSYQPNQVEYMGNHWASMNSFLIFNNPETYLLCPMNYRDDFNDSYEYLFGTNQVTTGGKYSIYDGYGTLILPNLTYPNVIRIYTLDTINFNGWQEITDKYLWIDMTTYNRVCEITLRKTVGIQGIFKSASYQEHTYLGVVSTDARQQAPSVNVYPNPVHDQVNVHVDGGSGSQFQLTDLAGQVVLRMVLQSEQVELGDLAAGLYLYTVMDDFGSVLKAGKLVKQ